MLAPPERPARLRVVHSIEATLVSARSNTGCENHRLQSASCGSPAWTERQELFPSGAISQGSLTGTGRGFLKAKDEQNKAAADPRICGGFNAPIPGCQFP